MVHRQGITNVEIIKGREKITLHGKIKLIYLSISGPIKLRLDSICSSVRTNSVSVDCY